MRRVINITITLMAIVSLSPAQVTQTYNYTGNYETFSVPDCVSEITIICYGASGFAGQGSSAGAKGGDAGLGAMISGIFAAKPGQQLYLFVGGAASGRNGGYNGGGMGTSAGHHGGGGGATDVRLNGVAPENRIIIAGGGGGGGLAGCTAGDYHGGRGGAGGGGYGGDGVSAVNGGQGGTGGHGATAGLPGTGCAPAYLGQAGTGGSAHGMGGTGGLQSGGINFCQAVGLNEGGGGGGGGGYVGGGGGGGGGGSSSQCNTVNTGSSGGGAGGTNYTSNDFSNVTETAGGAPAGNGKIVITYYINPTPDAPAGLFSQTFCNSATISDLQANGDDLKWYAAATGGNEIQYSAGVSQGNTYYTSQTVNNCESSERLPVNVTLNIPAPPTGEDLQNFCNSATVADLQASGATVKWYDAATDGVAFDADTELTNKSYYASQTLDGCESQDRLAVTVSISQPDAPLGDELQTVCNKGTLTDLVASGANIRWYDAANGGAAFDADTEVTNRSYYASQMLDGCEGQDRLAVTVSISQPDAPLGDEIQTICNSGSLADLEVEGISIQWHDAAMGGNYLDPGTLLIDGTHYYASQVIGLCESKQRLAVEAHIADAIADADVIVVDNTLTAQITGVTYEWIDCVTGAAISGETGKQFVAKRSGRYALRISNSCGSNTGDCFNLIVTATEIEEEHAPIRVYPNPSVGSVTIKAGRVGKTYLLVNAQGVTMQTGIVRGETVVDMNAMRPGVYLLKIEEAVVKLIKQ